MNRQLLDWLACPRCKGGLKLAGRELGGDDVQEGVLSCARCPGSYPVVKGVPDFSGASRDEVLARISSRFGQDWEDYSLDRMRRFHEAMFMEWIFPLGRKDFEGKDVLDAGCGAGRFSVVAHSLDARSVTGLDLSPAVFKANGHATPSRNLHFVCGNLLDPPFGRSFDLIYSIGVLHHLPDPKSGFQALVRQLKPGGGIYIWVYAQEGNRFLYLLLNPLRRWLTPHISGRLLIWLSWPLAFMVQLGYRTFYRPLGWAGLEGVRSRLPLADYLAWLSRFNLEMHQHVVLDQLIAPITHLIRRADLEEWFRDCGLEDVAIVMRNRNSWRAVGRKPR